MYFHFEINLSLFFQYEQFSTRLPSGMDLLSDPMYFFSPVHATSFDDWVAVEAIAGLVVNYGISNTTVLEIP